MGRLEPARLLIAVLAQESHAQIIEVVLSLIITAARPRSVTPRQLLTGVQGQRRLRRKLPKRRQTNRRYAGSSEHRLGSDSHTRVRRRQQM